MVENPLHRWLLVAFMCTATMVGAAEMPSAAAQQILQDMRAFSTLGTVLHVGAHPDDENTQLIAYFSRGRAYRTAYLSLTRGDGGQNEIGPEFDEKLGLARTQELLTARQIDGGRQFFTRAIDFGYSKTPEETLAFWDKKEVLGDVVRIIRQFRPDVIVTRFPIPPGSGGHGHHTASAMLAVEAFKLAGDVSAYPEHLREGLSVWQPKRVLWNGFGRGGNALTGPTVPLDIGGTDPVTGESFASLASRSIGMHKTQGVSRRGPEGPNVQTLMLLAGEPAEKDVMDGVDTTWARVPGGAEIGMLAEKAMAGFKPEEPAASVPALLELRTKLAGVAKGDPVVDDKRAELDGILQKCLGLEIEITTDRAEVVPGETIPLQMEIRTRVPLTWIERMGRDQEKKNALQPGTSTHRLTIPVGHNTPPTQPYWLREEGRSGIYRVDDPSLIGRPENPSAFPIEQRFEVEGQTLVITTEPIAKSSPAGRAGRVAVIPPVSLDFVSAVSLFSPGATRVVAIDVTAARDATIGTLGLDAPAQWRVEPKSQPFRLAKAGEKIRLTFAVTAPNEPAQGRVLAHADVGGQRYSNERAAIDYAHIPRQLLQPPARARWVSAEVAVKGKKVGYLPGAGDATAMALEQLGYAVTLLAGADLTAEKLKDFDAVVIGVRAFNERTDLAANLRGLFAYVENGGTVVAQYNRPNGLVTPELGPYQLAINGPAPALRVTDEKSPVEFLAPEHPVLNTPNKITAADFSGWVQERGAYFPSSWDMEKYATILALNDPGEKPLKSGLLIAQHGKGHFVYTGLAFFRQLPAGVPGAYRLFANVVSLGK